MAEYTVTDSETGRKITFDWNGAEAPTQNDMMAVFAEANRQTQPKATPQKPYAGEEMSTGGKLLTGIGKGMTDVGTGLLQRVLEGGEAIRNATGMQSNQPNIDRLTNIVDENRRAFQPLSDTSTAANVGNFIGNVAPAIAIPGGVAGGALRRAGTSALAGGAIGAAQATGKDDSVLQNTLLGGATGGLASGALSAAGKGYNAVRGKLPENFIEALSKKYGIRTTLGEAIDNPIVQRAETWLERIPFVGLKGFREKQAIEAKNAFNDYVGNYMANPGLEFGSPTTIQANRKYAGKLFEDMKGIVDNVRQKEIPKVVEKIKKDAINHTYEVVPHPAGGGYALKIDGAYQKGHGVTSFFRDKETPEAIGQRFISDKQKAANSITEETVAKQYYDFNIKPDLSKETVNEITERFPKFFKGFEDNQRKGVFKKIKGGQKLTFEEIWDVRSNVGEMVGQAKKKLMSGEINETQLSQVKKLYSSLNKDIDQWADGIGHPEIKTAIKEANNAYKQFVVKYDALDRATAIIQKDLQQGKPFSPQKFANALTTISNKNKYSGKFTKDEIQEMTGLANIMQTVKRSAYYKENLPTGDRWGLPLIGTAGLGYASPAGLGTVGSTVAITRFLTTTKSGKNLALAASKVEPNSKSMQIITKMIYNQVPKWAATQASGATRNY